MVHIRLISLLLLLLLLRYTPLVLAESTDSTVGWDQYSLIINGKRVFIYSGEFHYERLPVPAMWRDVLEKYKANGMNAVSIYFFWSYHSASTTYFVKTPSIRKLIGGPEPTEKGSFDFTSPGKDIQNLLDIASEVGLYVIARPGPYCNAETNGGGLALWGSDGSLGSLRTSDETYHQVWLPWIREVDTILAKNQVDNGGPVILLQIENELQETRTRADKSLILYMEQIEHATRSAGVTVPLISNEKGMRSQSWSSDYVNVGGAVDIYGLDSYPGGLRCTSSDHGFKVDRAYYMWFQNYSHTQPEQLPEFEGGTLSPWGSSTFYDDCQAQHDPAFVDVFYKNNIGQRITIQNIYMAFGGTNSGNLAAPIVYTSYDYAAPLRETREVTTKFKQAKLIGLFTRLSQDLRKTVMESNGTGNAVSTTDIWSWVLRNPDNHAGFYTLQHSASSSRAITTFDVHLITSIGVLIAPNVQLNGRQSKIVTTDYHFADRNMLYCTADVLIWGAFPEAVLVLYAEVGQTSEFAFLDHLDYNSYGTTKVNATQVDRNQNAAAAYTHYTYTQAEGSSVLLFSDGTIFFLLDTKTAWTFFAPALTTNPDVAPDEQVFVLGPYNVRSAKLNNGVVILLGDNENTTGLEVYAGRTAHSVIWNGKPLQTEQTPYGSLTATAPGAENRVVDIPELSWRVADSLPEAQRQYDDSRWVICNKSTTRSPIAPLTLPVLFSSDYGYYAGIKIYRGHFDGSHATSANITMQGGLAAGFSCWLNGKLVGYNRGDPSATRVSASLDFTNATLYDTDNVMTVVADYTGHDETTLPGAAGLENPRGILGAWLYNGSNSLNFTQWKIQGNAGGDRNIDPIQGPMNEDGLYGTRLGWHLPGFDASGPDWSPGSPLEGLKQAGIKWYIANFELYFDEDLDVPLGIELNAPADTIASVQIYMNGYQYGKYIPHIGPQTRFPFPPGVINNRGQNSLALALWAMTDGGARLSNATLFAYAKYETGFNFAQDWSELQPRWTKDRLQYA